MSVRKNPFYSGQNIIYVNTEKINIKKNFNIYLDPLGDKIVSQDEDLKSLIKQMKDSVKAQYEIPKKRKLANDRFNLKDVSPQLQKVFLNRIQARQRTFVDETAIYKSSKEKKQSKFKQVDRFLEICEKMFKVKDYIFDSQAMYKVFKILSNKDYSYEYDTNSMILLERMILSFQKNQGVSNFKCENMVNDISSLPYDVVQKWYKIWNLLEVMQYKIRKQRPLAKELKESKYPIPDDDFEDMLDDYNFGKYFIEKQLTLNQKIFYAKIIAMHEQGQNDQIIDIIELMPDDVSRTKEFKQMFLEQIEDKCLETDSVELEDQIQYECLKQSTDEQMREEALEFAHTTFDKTIKSLAKQCTTFFNGKWEYMEGCQAVCYKKWGIYFFHNDESCVFLSQNDIEMFKEVISEIICSVMVAFYSQGVNYAQKISNFYDNIYNLMGSVDYDHQNIVPCIMRDIEIASTFTENTELFDKQVKEIQAEHNFNFVFQEVIKWAPKDGFYNYMRYLRGFPQHYFVFTSLLYNYDDVMKFNAECDIAAIQDIQTVCKWVFYKFYFKNYQKAPISFINHLRDNGVDSYILIQAESGELNDFEHFRDYTFNGEGRDLFDDKFFSVKDSTNIIDDENILRSGVSYACQPLKMKREILFMQDKDVSFEIDCQKDAYLSKVDTDNFVRLTVKPEQKEKGRAIHMEQWRNRHLNSVVQNNLALVTKISSGSLLAKSAQEKAECINNFVFQCNNAKVNGFKPLIYSLDFKSFGHSIRPQMTQCIYDIAAQFYSQPFLKNFSSTVFNQKIHTSIIGFDFQIENPNGCDGQGMRNGCWQLLLLCISHLAFKEIYDNFNIVSKDYKIIPMFYMDDHLIGMFLNLKKLRLEKGDEKMLQEAIKQKLITEYNKYSMVVSEEKTDVSSQYFKLLGDLFTLKGTKITDSKAIITMLRPQKTLVPDLKTQISDLRSQASSAVLSGENPYKVYKIMVRLLPFKIKQINNNIKLNDVCGGVPFIIAPGKYGGLGLGFAEDLIIGSQSYRFANFNRAIYKSVMTYDENHIASQKFLSNYAQGDTSRFKMKSMNSLTNHIIRTNPAYMQFDVLKNKMQQSVEFIQKTWVQCPNTLIKMFKNIHPYTKLIQEVDKVSKSSSARLTADSFTINFCRQKERRNAITYFIRILRLQYSIKDYDFLSFNSEIKKWAKYYEELNLKPLKDILTETQYQNVDKQCKIVKSKDLISGMPILFGDKPASSFVARPVALSDQMKILVDIIDLYYMHQVFYVDKSNQLFDLFEKVLGQRPDLSLFNLDFSGSPYRDHKQLQIAPTFFVPFTAQITRKNNIVFPKIEVTNPNIHVNYGALFACALLKVDDGKIFNINNAVKWVAPKADLQQVNWYQNRVSEFDQIFSLQTSLRKRQNQMAIKLHREGEREVSKHIQQIEMRVQQKVFQQMREDNEIYKQALEDMNKRNLAYEIELNKLKELKKKEIEYKELKKLLKIEHEPNKMIFPAHFNQYDIDMQYDIYMSKEKISSNLLNKVGMNIYPSIFKSWCESIVNNRLQKEDSIMLYGKNLTKDFFKLSPEDMTEDEQKLLNFILPNQKDIQTLVKICNDFGVVTQFSKWIERVLKQKLSMKTYTNDLGQRVNQIINSNPMFYYNYIKDTLKSVASFPGRPGLFKNMLEKQKQEFYQKYISFVLNWAQRYLRKYMRNSILHRVFKKNQSDLSQLSIDQQMAVRGFLEGDTYNKKIARDMLVNEGYTGNINDIIQCIDFIKITVQEKYNSVLDNMLKKNYHPVNISGNFVSEADEICYSLIQSYRLLYLFFRNVAKHLVYGKLNLKVSYAEATELEISHVLHKYKINCEGLHPRNFNQWTKFLKESANKGPLEQRAESLQLAHEQLEKRIRLMEFDLGFQQEDYSEQTLFANTDKKQIKQVFNQLKLKKVTSISIKEQSIVDIIFEPVDRLNFKEIFSQHYKSEKEHQETMKLIKKNIKKVESSDFDVIVAKKIMNQEATNISVYSSIVKEAQIEKDDKIQIKYTNKPAGDEQIFSANIQVMQYVEEQNFVNRLVNEEYANVVKAEKKVEESKGTWKELKMQVQSENTIKPKEEEEEEEDPYAMTDLSNMCKPEPETGFGFDYD